MENDIVTVDGEVEAQTLPAHLDQSVLTAYAKAEIDTQITTARRYPRPLGRVVKAINNLVCLDEESAEECVYGLVRSGKSIRGPSVRLAEIVAQQWGNCRVDARMISIDEKAKILTAEGMFHDLETNMATRTTVQRRISDRHGRLFNADMIAVSSLAACAIAKRNAILAGVPKAVWRQAYQKAEETIRGSIKTLSDQRSGAIAAFAHFGLNQDQVLAILQIEAIEEVTLDHVVTLRAMFRSIKNGEQTVEEVLRLAGGASAPQHEIVKSPLDDDEPPAAAEAVSEGPDVGGAGKGEDAPVEAPEAAQEAEAGGGAEEGPDAAVDDAEAAAIAEEQGDGDDDGETGQAPDVAAPDADWNATYHRLRDEIRAITDVSELGEHQHNTAANYPDAPAPILTGLLRLYKDRADDLMGDQGKARTTRRK